MIKSFLVCLLICFVVSANSSSNTSLRSYMYDVQSEFEKVYALEQRLSKAINVFNFTTTNSTLIPQIIQSRSNQLKKVLNARTMLSLEISVLSERCNKYDGDDCSLPSCSGHGTFNSTTCICDKDWTGSNCSVPICFSIPATNSSVCSGSGKCVSNNTCIFPSVSGSVDIVRSFPNGSIAKNCKDYLSVYSESGLYWIKPDASSPSFTVYCEQTFYGGGWVLISTRNKSIAPKYADIVKPDRDGSSMKDDKWAIMKTYFTDLLWKDADRDEYAVTLLATWKSAGICQSLSTRLIDSKLGHMEITGCTTTGSDYCLLGDSAFNTGVCAACESNLSSPSVMWKEWNFKSYSIVRCPEISLANVYVR